VTVVHLMLLMLPWAANPALAVNIMAAQTGVNAGLTEAAAAVEVITPAWESALRTELVDSPVYADKLVAAITAAATETGIDPGMLWSVAYTETHGRHCRDDGSIKRGNEGEVGVMQIKPFWEKALKRTYGLDIELDDVQQNVRAAAYILKRGGDDSVVMLSYYNTGKQLRGCAYQRKVMKYWESLEQTQPVAMVGIKQPLPGVRTQEPLHQTTVHAGPSSPRNQTEVGSPAGEVQPPAEHGHHGRSWRPKS
jgi:soluble lytic murein transglycosylase-like protein